MVHTPKLTALALLLACASFAARAGTDNFADAFVHFPGEAEAPAFADVAEANPQVAKLLSQPADLWERIRRGFAIPDLDSKLVAQQAQWYAARPELVQAIVQRSRRYLHYIVDEVERRGLPTELALLPFVESGFNPMALSSAQASGLWQFIPQTGTKYKLAQNTTYDGRRDVIASTSAALDYLQFLYTLNGKDWQRALASYNWGEAAVARAVERNRARGLPDAYGDLAMPDETRNYVPRLLAIKHIIMNPAAYGITLAELPNEPVFDVVPVPNNFDLKLAAQFAQTPLPEFLAFNPAYNGAQASGAGGAGLVVPVEKAEVFKVNLERHQEQLAEKSRTRTHKGTAAKSPGAKHTRF